MIKPQRIMKGREVIRSKRITHITHKLDFVSVIDNVVEDQFGSWSI
jgi:hypothetical protein